jgi:hypothetical protein
LAVWDYSPIKYPGIFQTKRNAWIIWENDEPGNFRFSAKSGRYSLVKEGVQ